MPRGRDIWPAYWMLGRNVDQVSWSACGEIDIMEEINLASKNVLWPISFNRINPRKNKLISD